jgi:hypothetical protein
MKETRPNKRLWVCIFVGIEPARFGIRNLNYMDRNSGSSQSACKCLAYRGLADNAFRHVVIHVPFPLFGEVEELKDTYEARVAKLGGTFGRRNWVWNLIGPYNASMSIFSSTPFSPLKSMRVN